MTVDNHLDLPMCCRLAYYRITQARWWLKRPSSFVCVPCKEHGKTLVPWKRDAGG